MADLCCLTSFCGSVLPLYCCLSFTHLLISIQNTLFHHRRKAEVVSKHSCTLKEFKLLVQFVWVIVIMWPESSITQQLMAHCDFISLAVKPNSTLCSRMLHNHSKHLQSHVICYWVWHWAELIAFCLSRHHTWGFAPHFEFFNTVSHIRLNVS